MKRTVPFAEATMSDALLPERGQEGARAADQGSKERLLALSVSVGLGALSELLEEEVDELVGPRGEWNPGRTAVRHGHEDGR